LPSKKKDFKDAAHLSISTLSAVEHTNHAGCYREKGEDWDAYYPRMRKLERIIPAMVRIVEVHAYRPADDDRDGKSCNSNSQ